MKQICFLSGKGGTGKTTLCAACASLEGRTVLLDADVESPNLSILIPHEKLHTEVFSAGKTALLDTQACTRCRRCADICAFGAISEDQSGDFEVTVFRCEGCGLCERICPASAISMREHVGGEWYVSGSRYGPVVHASLAPSEESSGKLIRILRMMAENLAEKGGFSTLLIDGPAGLGCPAISTLAGLDAVVAVTEPTIAGLSDLERIVSLSGHFNIPTCLCINKSTLNREIRSEIEKFCKKREIALVGEIPYDDSFNEALVKGVIMTEYDRGFLNESIAELWKNILRFVEG
ncbi:MAG: ATP-binding protein [Vulcanimicrobiota bacterium]